MSDKIDWEAATAQAQELITEAGGLDRVRVMVEAAAAGMPMRGDPVEAWLRRERNQYSQMEDSWHAIDALLDDYRLHADTGTPLSGEVQVREEP